MEIREHPRAKIEVRKHFDYYWNKSVSVAEKFNFAYIATIQRIRKHPSVNPIATPGKRWRMIEGFPCKVIYEYDKTTLYIIAVMHEKQKPLYWKERRFDWEVK